MLKKAGAFVLRSQLHAGLTALVCALLPFIGGWLAAVVVGLVTLRKNFFEGFFVVLWASLPAIAWAVDGNWLLLMTNGLFGFVVVWLLAGVMKKTGSWSATIGLASLLGLLVVLVIHLILGEPHMWWIKQLTVLVSQSSEMLSTSVNTQEVQSAIKSIAPFLTGLQTVMILLFAIVALVGARAIEGALLSKPNINNELYFVRIHRFGILLLVIIGALAVWGPLIFRDLLPVVILPFILAAFSLVHGMVALKKWSSFWLFGFYCLLFLSVIFYPPLLLVIVLISIVDSIVNFRTPGSMKKAR